MTRVIASYNIKGGVGKTSAAVNLAYLAAAEGARTLVWDLDPQGASTYLFRIKPKIKGGGDRLIRGKSPASAHLKGTDHERLDLLPADFSYRHMDLALDASKGATRTLAGVIAPLGADYDYIFLDCPPSISLVSEGVFEAADVLLVPLVPATLSSRTFEQLLKVVGGSAQVLAFFSMVDGRKTLHRRLVEQLRSEHPEVLQAAIPAAAVVEQMGEHRQAIHDFAPRSPAARAYRALWSELRDRIGDR